jgi:uncharacterized membrane protein YhaH (DUF805 family)
MYWYVYAIKHYADFQGVSHRQAFWMFMLVNCVISLSIIGVELMTNNPGWLDALYSVITLIPLLAIITRRIRDTGLPVWSLLVLFVPVIGLLILVYFLCLPSQPRAQLIKPKGDIA